MSARLSTVGLVLSNVKRTPIGDLARDRSVSISGTHDLLTAISQGVRHRK